VRVSKELTSFWFGYEVKRPRLAAGCRRTGPWGLSCLPGGRREVV
jgi:hypothetical protein